MELPERRFYLFGMGSRRKLLYRSGELVDALSGDRLRRWQVADERIEPTEYRVTLELANGGTAALAEDEEGVWLDEGGGRESLAEGRLSLPPFEGRPHGPLLRALHQELLINLVGGRPVPNLLVYSKPWHRDAAMVLMCLEKTGNLGLVADWVLGLEEVFDRNNAGEREPDNLGQDLYMISLVGDATHPLVPKVIAAAEEFRKGSHIVGRTDFAAHPVYQTKWLKFGLGSLGLEDPYEIPLIEDPYSSLFWWAYTDEHVEGPCFGPTAAERYPYLVWAEANFHGCEPPGSLRTEPYPLTWEAEASQADYPRMAIVSEDYVERRIAAPHSWHAAEMFLYLLD